jgi:hypothetical protein
VSVARRRVGVVGLLALGLALGGCGSADVKPKPIVIPQGADPVAWVSSFCGGLSSVIAGAAAIPKSPPSPQAQKDGLLTFADATQKAFATTAQELTQLGPPRINDGKQVQDTTVGFFTTAAATVGSQRAKIAALDAKDPNFAQKANDLVAPGLGTAGTQIQGLTSNQDLAPAFGTSQECRRLGAGAASH